MPEELGGTPGFEQSVETVQGMPQIDAIQPPAIAFGGENPAQETAPSDVVLLAETIPEGHKNPLKYTVEEFDKAVQTGVCIGLRGTNQVTKQAIRSTLEVAQTGNRVAVTDIAKQLAAKQAANKARQAAEKVQESSPAQASEAPRQVVAEAAPTTVVRPETKQVEESKPENPVVMEEVVAAISDQPAIVTEPQPAIETALRQQVEINSLAKPEQVSPQPAEQITAELPVSLAPQPPERQPQENQSVPAPEVTTPEPDVVVEKTAVQPVEGPIADVAAEFEVPEAILPKSAPLEPAQGVVEADDQESAMPPVERLVLLLQSPEPEVAEYLEVTAEEPVIDIASQLTAEMPPEQPFLEQMTDIVLEAVPVEKQEHVMEQLQRAYDVVEHAMKALTEQLPLLSDAVEQMTVTPELEALVIEVLTELGLVAPEERQIRRFIACLQDEIAGTLEIDSVPHWLGLEIELAQPGTSVHLPANHHLHDVIGKLVVYLSMLKKQVA